MTLLKWQLKLMLAIRSFVIDISQCLHDSNFLLYKVAAEVNVSGKESINPKIVKDKLVIPTADPSSLKVKPFIVSMWGKHS